MQCSHENKMFARNDLMRSKSLDDCTVFSGKITINCTFELECYPYPNDIIKLHERIKISTMMYISVQVLSAVVYKLYMFSIYSR